MERRDLCDRLDALGFASVDAEDGVSAQVALSCHRVSVLLLDLQLPYMSGRELLRRIEAEGGTHRPPVVVLSGGSDTWDRVSCRGLGVSAFLRRPLRDAELLDALARLGLHARGTQRVRTGNHDSVSSTDTLPKSKV